MIPSQAAYLRKKNEELLNVLEENARHLNRKVEICTELLRGRPRYRREEFTEHQPTSPEMSPTTRFIRGVEPVRTLQSSSPRRASSAIQIRSSSAGRLRSPRRGHSTCLPNRPDSRDSSTENRWSKLQQDLACHAHMHGHTQSHALSKCYCTRRDASDTGISFTGRSRIVPEPCMRRSRIPPRLKEKRYQTTSPKRRPGNVKWAVPNEPVPNRLPQETHRVDLPFGDCDEVHRNHAVSLCGSSVARGDIQMKPRSARKEEPISESDSEWFAKVKSFRKSNWEDCHAPERREKDACGCNCNRVYMIGERMFLEPVSSSFLNKQCCCPKPRENPNPPPRDTIVTLPKVRPIKRGKSPKKKAENRPPNQLSGTYSMEGPCFLTGHKTGHDDDRIRAFVQQCPPDSFALRYQKGVDPRKP